LTELGCLHDAHGLRATADSWAGLTENQQAAGLALELPVNSLLPEARYEKMADGASSLKGM